MSRHHGASRKERSRFERGILGIALVALLSACGKSCAKESPSPVSPRPSHVTAVSEAESAHGKQLIEQYQCNRCHDGIAEVHEAPRDKHCAHCHAQILDGKFPAAKTDVERWSKVIDGLELVPSLEASRGRFRREWLSGFIQKPHDLRPNLVPKMPRLNLSPSDADEIAAYLAPDAEDESVELLRGSNVDRGRAVFNTQGCATCHQMTGVLGLTPSEINPQPNAAVMRKAMLLAPDLRYARERWTPLRLVAWMRDPSHVKSDSAMPKIALTDAQVSDVAAFVLAVPLAEKKVVPFVRLPILTRPVTYDEVNAKVFHRTCWHCHSDADYAIGDGGPGNTGGFGFKARGLDLGSYEGTFAGILDKKTSERTSVFAKRDDGTPHLLRALLNRHEEEGGADTGEVRGMPLGYPPLPAEEIQLVESWIAQGRPR